MCFTVSMLYFNKSVSLQNKVISSFSLFCSLLKLLIAHVWCKKCKQPVTLYVFFSSRMCLVRMKQEGRSGKYMCRIIVHFMWEDVEQRGRVMGVSKRYQILVLDSSNERLPDLSFISSRMALLLDFCIMLPNVKW